MTNKEKYKKAFDVLASSEQISLEVENMANKKRKKSFMAITVAAVIVFGTLTVGAAAYYNWSNGLSEELRIDEEKQKMLEDTENIISMAEVDPNYESTFEYAADVVEIPTDVAVEIKDDEHVVIGSDDVTLKEGDRFVVYEDGLPLAYVAKKVNYKNNQCQVQVKKADHSVYEYVDEQGSLELTPENSEFIPAEGVEVQSLEGTAKSSNSANISYADGKLSLITTAGGVSTEICLSDLCDFPSHCQKISRYREMYPEHSVPVSASCRMAQPEESTSSM